MAVHTFSTRSADEQAIVELKQYCQTKGINFSRVVIKALKATKEYENATTRSSNTSTVAK